jgi:hypothetical protein
VYTCEINGLPSHNFIPTVPNCQFRSLPVAFYISLSIKQRKYIKCHKLCPLFSSLSWALYKCPKIKDWIEIGNKSCIVKIK